MFFNKKKSKIDPKVRFQNRQFNQKLHQARTFKRVAKPVPDSKLDKFLNRIGLGSRLMQIATLLLLIVVVYLVYIPNFLSLQSIFVTGASSADSSAIERAIRTELGNAPFYNPQRNILFLSKARVQKAVQSVAGVDSIVSITKNYNQKTLTVSVISKYEKYLVRTNDHVFDVYNDGTLKGEAGINRDGWASVVNPNMIKVDIASVVTTSNTREFFNANTTQYLNELYDQIKGILGSTFDYVSLPNDKLAPPPIDPADSIDPLANQTTEPSNTSLPPQPTQAPTNTSEMTLPINPGQLDVIMEKGTDPNKTFRVIVNTQENANDVVQRLNLLLSQTAPDRYNALSYIDLRVKTRAYVCLLGAVCN